MNNRLVSLLVSVVMCGSLVAFGPAPASAATCAADGANCKVGDVGPGGGIVFYDAGSQQNEGRFLEAKTTSALAGGIWGSEGRFLNMPMTTSAIANNIFGSSGTIFIPAWIAMKQIGYGYRNSLLMSLDPSSVYSRLKNTAFSGGFFLPSKNELDALYNYWKTSGDKRLDYADAPMWTSSPASATFAWYQLFQDGTQFTDANGIIRKLAGNIADTSSREHVGSGFKSKPFYVIGVSAFPNNSTKAPTWQVVSEAKANPSCSAGGANTVCKVGDIGPSGGIVFYDAGKDEYWGRYLEIAPKECEGVKIPWRPAGNTKTVYTNIGGYSAAELRVLAKGVGMGQFNTRAINVQLGAGTYAAKYVDDLICGGVDDWFLPSKDELDLAYNLLAQNRVGGNDTPIGGFNKGYYWTSTDYNNTTAWAQYFMDGQQFDRVQTLSGNKLPPANPFRVRPIRAIKTNNVVLACAQGGVCKIGDVGPGGGKVFYVSPNFFMANGKGVRYLEVAPEPIGGEKKTTWTCLSNDESIPTSASIGSGAGNTSLMQVACPGFYDQILNVGGGKTDWFIPSKDELNELFEHQEQVGGFSVGNYWSSSEKNVWLAWGYYFGKPGNKIFGATNGNLKSAYYMRPVRAFGW